MEGVKVYGQLSVVSKAVLSKQGVLVVPARENQLGIMGYFHGDFLLSYSSTLTRQ